MSAEGDANPTVEARAQGTLVIIGFVLILAVVTMWLFREVGSSAGAVGPWIVLGAAALAGACVGRLHWISHFAFKTKTFDPLLIPHHYAWMVSGAAVALVLLAFPAQLPVLGVNAPATLALAFAFGIFSEETWDALHSRVRAFLGKPPRLDPALPAIDGIDVPLDALKDVKVPGADTAKVIGALESHGIRYSHQLIASEKAGHLSRLAKGIGVPEPALRELSRAGDSLRSAVITSKPNDEAGALPGARTLGIQQLR